MEVKERVGFCVTTYSFLPHPKSEICDCRELQKFSVGVTTPQKEKKQQASQIELDSIQLGEAR
jgi:hypothetical protein